MFDSSVVLPNGASEETEPAQAHVRKRIECHSPANRKRTRACLAESGEMAAWTNQSDNVRGSCTSVEKDAEVDRDKEYPSGEMAARTNQSDNVRGSCTSVEKDVEVDRDEEYPKPSLVTSTDPDQEVVQEEAALDEIPAGWTRIKLEPDW